MDGKHLLLLVFGLVMLVKAVWGIAAPASLRAVTSLATGWGLRVRYAVAALALAIGIFTWGVLLLHESLSSRMLGIIALVMAGASVVWLDRQLVQAIGRLLVTGRGSIVIRLFSVLVAALALWMIWAAATGR